MKNFNLYQFVSTLGLDVFLSNTTIEHRKYIVTSDLDIIKSDVLTKIREIKFREIKPIILIKLNLLFLLAWKNEFKNGVIKTV